jgi:hypothetical protein
MGDIVRMIRQIPERRRIVEQQPEPLRAFLAEFLDNQDHELRALQEDRSPEV